MPVANYKVFSWGNPIGEGAMASLNVAVSGVAKTSNTAMPLAVANELICADLGRALRLPIPPSFLVYNSDDKPFHVSLNFYLSGEDLPPADAAAIAENCPDLACGVILFDTWICNPDRHAKNLAYDKTTKQLTLFDHSHSLLAGADGKTRLNGCRSQAAIGGHCLSSHLVALEGFQRWHERVMAVPEFYLREAVAQTIGIGPMTEELSTFTTDFLLDRRAKLLELIQGIRANFPKVVGALWDNLKGGTA